VQNTQLITCSSFHIRNISLEENFKLNLDIIKAINLALDWLGNVPTMKPFLINITLIILDSWLKIGKLREHVLLQVSKITNLS
jgi:hypothetical protein